MNESKREIYYLWRGSARLWVERMGFSRNGSWVSCVSPPSFCYGASWGWELESLGYRCAILSYWREGGRKEGGNREREGTVGGKNCVELIGMLGFDAERNGMVLRVRFGLEVWVGLEFMGFCLCFACLLPLLCMSFALL